MSRLIQRLRDTPCNREPFTPSHADCQCRVTNAAADEIERLEAELKKWRSIAAERFEQAQTNHAAYKKLRA